MYDSGGVYDTTAEWRTELDNFKAQSKKAKATKHEEYTAVDGGKRPPSSQSSKGHARLSSSETIVASLPNPSLPLRSQIAHQLRSLPGQFQLPWKARAIEVRNQPPRRGFRVDSWDVSTSSDPSNDSGAHPEMAPTGAGDAGRSQARDTILEEDEADVEASLLSPVARSENTDFLSSLSSKPRSVQVIPPTPTESSHGSAIRQFPIPLPNVTRLPPPPTQPAPLPPSSSRDTLQLQRVSQTEPIVSRPKPINIPPFQMPHSPSGHYHSPENVPPRVTSSLSASRQHPITGDVDQNTVTFHPLRRPGGLASPSSIESLYVDATSIHPAPSHQQSLSDIRSLMGPPDHSPPVMFNTGLSFEEDMIRQDLNPSRSSSSLQYTRSSSPYDRALSPTILSPLRRRPDDSAFNRESSNPSDSSHYRTHSRNVSTEHIIPGRGDAVMLFPGSVRGAGYAPQSSPRTPSPATHHDRNI